MKQFILSLTSSIAFTLCTFSNTNAQIITTVAGNGASSYSGDRGAAIAAGIHMPVGVSFDTANNMYITDNFNLCIRKVNKFGIITTFAGNGTSGYSGDGGPATAAQISVVGSIATDNAGNVYIVDPGNDVIRKVNAAGIITTVVGNGAIGYTGDHGHATAATLNLPQSVAIDDTGNLYIADGNNNCIRKVNTAGIIYTIAGNGTDGYRGDGGMATASLLNSPEAVAVDHAGNIYIADYSNNRIRKINTAGIITTIAGNGTGGYSGDGHAATLAAINNPADVSLDNSGNIYIADGNNVIRMVNNLGIISTIAGNGHGGFTGDGGAASAAKLNNPQSVSVDNYGAIYIADANNNRIRKVVSCAAYNVSPIYAATNNVCSGTTTTLSDNTEGGVWSASNGNATITSGVVSGITAGIDTIYLSVTNSCGTRDTSVVVTINAIPNAGVISGHDSVCLGTSTTLTNSVAGGTWSATNSNITLSGGTITGISTGTDTVKYTVSNSCGTRDTSVVVTINAIPNAGTISGNDSVCLGTSTALTNSAAGGIWSATNSNTTISGGMVTGIVAGTDTIMYTVTNTCGTTSVAHTITVNPMPVAGAIAGVDTLIVAGSTLLIDTASTGIWASSNSAIVTISATGLAVAIAPGMDTITYAVTNTCGTTVATKTINVIVEHTTGIQAVDMTLAGIQVYPNPAHGNCTVKVPASATSIELIDALGRVVVTKQISDKNAQLVAFDFNGIAQGTYILSINSADGVYTQKLEVRD